MDEDHQRLVGCGSLWQVVANVMEFEPVAQGEYLMVQTGVGLREIPETIASCSYEKEVSLTMLLRQHSICIGGDGR